ncbi:MAG: Rrf2 family transcriptional regulator [Oscillospiraceae bacterium]|nr:Rrf2 family transcriptional regulator [Oscillospiraceae bacterium]
MTAEFIVAVHALALLDRRAASCSSEALAKNVCTNPARVRKVLSKLERAGLVAAKNGSRGGYAPTKPAGEVTLLQILDAMGAPCVCLRWRSGALDPDCVVASGMSGVMDGVLAELEDGCRAVLARTTLADIDRRLFPDGAAEKEAPCNT